MSDPFAPPRPVLELIKTAEKTDDGCWLLTVSVDMQDGAGPSDYPFGYDPADPYGLTPQVTAWLEAHPTFKLP